MSCWATLNRVSRVGKPGLVRKCSWTTAMSIRGVTNSPPDGSRYSTDTLVVQVQHLFAHVSLLFHTCVMGSLSRQSTHHVMPCRSASRLTSELARPRNINRFLPVSSSAPPSRGVAEPGLTSLSRSYATSRKGFLSGHPGFPPQSASGGFRDHTDQ